jgi:adenylate cyclase
LVPKPDLLAHLRRWLGFAECRRNCFNKELAQFGRALLDVAWSHQMTIRKKILLLAGILLALFGVVVGILAIVQKLDGDQIRNIAEYELPLTRLVAELDVDTDRYELGILRALRLDPLNPPDLAAAIAAKKEVGDELRADVDTATALLAKAIQDPGYRAAERVELARIEGSFKYLTRSLEGFLATGEQTMADLVEGRREDARTASLGFAKYAQAFGPDLSEIRRNLAGLTDRATRNVLARQRLNTFLSFGLFLAACVYRESKSERIDDEVRPR